MVNLRIMNDFKIKQLIHAIKSAKIVCIDDVVSDVTLVGHTIVGEADNVALSLKYILYSCDVCIDITEQGFSDARIEFNEIYCKDLIGDEVLISLHRLVADNTYLSQIE